MSVKNTDLYLRQINESIESIRNYTCACTKDSFCNDPKRFFSLFLWQYSKQVTIFLLKFL